jgi:hypothetical protein
MNEQELRSIIAFAFKGNVDYWRRNANYHIAMQAIDAAVFFAKENGFIEIEEKPTSQESNAY